MIVLVEILLLVFILGLWWYKNDRQRYSSYPPGPPRLPIIGSLLHLTFHPAKFPWKVFESLGCKYGNGEMLFLQVGQNETIVFNSPNAIHEMLTHENATGRYQFEVIKDRHENRNLGLIWGYGKPWQNLRRFTMRNLRDFGFGKSSVMDVVINEEIEKFLEKLKLDADNSPGRVIHVTDLFSLSMVNVLWRLVSGKAYDLDHPKIKRLVQLNREWFESTIMGSDLTDSFPFLRDYFPNWSGRTVQKRMHKELYDYGMELLQEHRKVSSQHSAPETFIDVFNRKIESSREDANTDFNDEQFVFSILDLFVGGSETSSNTLNFGILYMILFPEIQDKVQLEIDREVPQGVAIDSSIKHRLPYTCATVLEILRYSTVIPIPAPRAATEDFTLDGYFIKKGTRLFANIYALHFSEKLWGDPNTFRPERFLNSDGTAVDQKVAERLKAFGAGKRFCIGQSLAELTMFQYLASTVRKFRFTKVPGTNPTTDPSLGITLAPHPFDVCVIDRNKNK